MGYFDAPSEFHLYRAGTLLFIIGLVIVAVRLFGRGQDDPRMLGNAIALGVLLLSLFTLHLTTKYLPSHKNVAALNWVAVLASLGATVYYTVSDPSAGSGGIVATCVGIVLAAFGAWLWRGSGAISDIDHGFSALITTAY